MLKKWKMAFPCDKKEKFLLQHRKTSQDAHVCTIWAHYHKLCPDSLLNLKWISDEIACCEPINDFLLKFTSIISCTCSSNLGNLLPISQEFVFFMRDGQKGSRYTGWEIFYLRWSSIFEKWVGTNAKL